MDLWNKIFLKFNHFGKDSKEKDIDSLETSQTELLLPSQSVKVARDHVRILLYRECDKRGRKLLYDSRTVVRMAIKDRNAAFRSTCSNPPTAPPLPPKICSSSASSVFSSNRKSKAKNSSSSCNNFPSENVPQSTFKIASVNPVESIKFAEVRDSFGYQYQKESLDTRHIGELVFGAVALAYKGPSAKVHLVKEPPGILFSRTFAAPRSYRRKQLGSCDTGLEDSFSSLCSNSVSDVYSTRMSDVSSRSQFPRHSNTNSSLVDISSGGCGIKSSTSEEDSGFSGPPSPFSTCGSYLTPYSTPTVGTPNSRTGSGNSLKNSGSFTSLQRRFVRHVTTSLDSIGLCSSGEELDFKSEYRNPATLGASFQSKLGLAVIVETNKNEENQDSQLFQWLFNHQDVLEASINKLQISMENAYQQRPTFVSYVYQSISLFQQELLDLACAPRIESPIWLSLLKNENEEQNKRLHDRLTQSLSCLLQHYDTKNTNFFVSKLLTGVLTHHLGWVSTVAPKLSFSDSSYKHSFSSKIDYHVMNILNESRPYNALWGQLCELTGAIGNPSKSTRTVLVGSDQNLLQNLLVVLSYLIRCTLVEEIPFENLPDCNSSSYTIKCNETFSGDFSSTTEQSTKEKINGLKNPKSEEFSSKSTVEFPRTEIRDSVKIIQRPKSEGECKWMLFDEDNIIINKNSSKDHKILTKVEERTNDSNTFLRIPASEKAGLKTSKTFSNLCFTESDSSSSNESSPGFTKSNLYPNLCNFEVDLDTKDKRYTDKCGGKRSSITVTAQPFVVEVEKSGDIVILSEESLFQQKSTDDKELKKHVLNEDDGKYKATVKLKNEENLIRALPTPLAFPKVDTFRMQGKAASTLDGNFKKIPKSSYVSRYPSLKQLIKDLKPLPATFTSSIATKPQPTKSHKRNRSDPTNGAFLEQMPPYSPPLQGVVEKPEMESCKLLVETDSSTSTISADSLLIELIDVPTLEKESSQFTQNAESLFGGILDHYSSVFVLHATTSEKIEDQLRADLISSSQKSILDSQPVESVAIVAEIGSW